jgi:hypothetical protein
MNVLLCSVYFRPDGRSDVMFVVRDRDREPYLAAHQLRCTELWSDLTPLMVMIYILFCRAALNSPNSLFRPPIFRHILNFQIATKHHLLHLKPITTFHIFNFIRRPILLIHITNTKKHTQVFKKHFQNVC